MVKPCCNRQSQLVVTKQPLYEYRDLWAEEAASLNNNTSEWSFGDSAIGNIGVTFDSGWECVSMSFQADTFSNSGIVQIRCVQYGPNGPIGALLGVIQLTGPTDGGGTLNHAKKFVDFAAPVAVSANSVVGFLTAQKSGNVSGARVYARFRRLIGSYVSDVSY